MAIDHTLKTLCGWNGPQGPNPRNPAAMSYWPPMETCLRHAFSSDLNQSIREKMRMCRKPVVCCLWPMLAVFLLIGCSQASKVEVDQEQPAQVSTKFERLSSVLTGIQESGAVSLYEGLPSIFWDPQLREQELNQKKIIKLHGYPFYEELLALKDADTQQLRALLSAKQSFKPYRSRKECGGYDPEYCVQWKKGDSITQVLISLECGEVKMFGPQSELLCDLSPEAHQKLKQLLGGYQKNNPAAGSNGASQAR